MQQQRRKALNLPVIFTRAGSVVALVMIFSVFCLTRAVVIADDNLKLIPRPASVEPGEGAFELTRQTTILTEPGSPGIESVGVFLRDALRAQTGLGLKIREAKSAQAAGSITLGINAKQPGLGAEGYELVISPERVTIRAHQPAGVFYGIQSLLQILSPALAADQGASVTKRIHLPSLRIVDRPEFAWRGLLLDCSRTFLPLDYLKKYVDVCSFYKMNVLQLHLTDDQGWRLEIRKHPRLTDVGSKFDASFVGEASGYYTQKKMKELVQYAAERHVTIVPEIEMPGHCLSLLKAYPELSCRGGADHYVIAPYLFMSDPDPKKIPKTPHGVLCPGNERTFQVLEDILAEVIELFPSDYIHIAGDECPKNFWKACSKCQARIKAEGLKDEEELQSYFIKRVARMVQARGRKAMGWEDTLQGGLAPGMALMSWRGMEAGITAAKLGHPVVMASKSHVYFDYSYNRTPASLVYSYDPIPPELDTPDLRARVLGGEACMWTHLARSETGIDMSVFPRLLALAEVLWTPTERRQWDDFSQRMNPHEAELKAKGVACFVRNEGLGLPNLTCGQDGRLWLVNAANEIYLRQGDKWEQLPGKARQVTSGPDGTIWSVSTQPMTGGYVLMRWSEPKKDWSLVGNDTAAVQISAAPDGSLWATTEAYAVYRFAEGKWANVQGLAREVSVGPDGTAWILTSDPAPGGFELFAAPPGGRFRRVQPPGAGVHIAAARTGQIWVSRENGDLRLLRDGKYHARPGRLTALTSTRSGGAWALATSSDGAKMNVIQWTSHGWKEIGPVP
jgi:hexosaminidase